MTTCQNLAKPQHIRVVIDGVWMWDTVFQKNMTGIKSTYTQFISRHKIRLQMVCFKYKILPRRSLLSKWHTSSKYTHTSNVIYAYKKATTFRAPIFTKLTKAPQQNTQVSYTKIYPNRIHVESTDTNSFTPLSKYFFHSGDFYQPHNHSTNFCEHQYQFFVQIGCMY